MINNKEMQMINDYCREYDEAVAHEKIREYCLGLMVEVVGAFNNDDIIKMLDGPVHRMDDFDDVFRYMKPSEVLESLGDIELCDGFFNEDTGESGDDVFDLAGTSIEEFADDLLSEEIDVPWYEDNDVQEIRDKEREMVFELERRVAVYDKARELFDMAMANDPVEVMNVLWNMTQD